MKPFLLALAILLLLSGCAPALPTLSPEQINAAAAATIAALPTNTPVPSATPAPTPQPTATELPPALAAAAGRLLVYTGANRDLYAWMPGGSRALTSSGGVQSARISSDGQWLAYVRARDNRDYSLWVVKADGGGERQVFSPGDFNALADDPYAAAVAPQQIDWVPGTHTLAFSTRPVYDGPGQLLYNDLWLAEAEGGAPRMLLDKKQGGDFYFSPDGKQIALVQPGSISLINADGSSRRDNIFTYDKVLTYSEYAYRVKPKWEPNGAALWVSVPPRDPLAQPAQPSSDWTIPVSGGAPAQVWSGVTPFLTEPERSPDGAWLAYLKPEQVGDTLQTDLHVVSLQTGVDTRYRNNTRSFTGWAPGQPLAFVFQADAASPPLLGMLDHDPVPLTAAPVRELKWFDSDSFAYTAYDNGMWNVYLGKIGADPVLADRFNGSEQDAPVLEVQ